MWMCWVLNPTLFKTYKNISIFYDRFLIFQEKDIAHAVYENLKFNRLSTVLFDLIAENSFLIQ